MGTKLIPPVSRRRPKWARYVSGQRLGLFFLVLLMMFFAISGYVGSARNHKLLDNAVRDRSVLIVSTGQLSDLSTQELVYIQQLVKIVEQQNDALKKAGQKIIVIPPAPQTPYVVTPPSAVKTPLPSFTPKG
jgi:hypothetical protein